MAIKPFQSLLHQGISLLHAWNCDAHSPCLAVSIPSSSGHQFTGSRTQDVKFSRIAVSIPSSSGHQFTGIADAHGTSPANSGFNPFFIRASVYCPKQPPSPAPWLLRFNPFFIRASVYCAADWHRAGRPLYGFNPFFIRASVYCRIGQAQDVRQAESFNPFFIRASVYWVRTEAAQARRAQAVSIPSSSGHQFTECPLDHAGLFDGDGFNPFFIRASVYCVASRGFQRASGRRFNPFFIRASVYWPMKSAAANRLANVSIPSSSGHQFTD